MADAENPGPARRAPGRPARISRERIVEAVAAADNLDTLTMRELAARLEVSHGALYRWVRNRDELFDLVSETLVERVLADSEIDGEIDGSSSAPEVLTRVGWAMHHHFLALPGFATHLARPHRHHTPSTDRLRAVIVAAFLADGVETAMATHSWQIFVTTTIGWLAVIENPDDLGPERPPFGQFLDVLLRGLPVRAPG